MLIRVLHNVFHCDGYKLHSVTEQVGKCAIPGVREGRHNSSHLLVLIDICNK